MNLQGANITPFTSNGRINFSPFLFANTGDECLSISCTVLIFGRKWYITKSRCFDVDIILHLEALQESFNKYFVEDSKRVWIRNPFAGSSPNELELQANCNNCTEESSMSDLSKRNQYYTSGSSVNPNIQCSSGNAAFEAISL